MATTVDANTPAWRDPKFKKLDKQRDRCADVLEGLDRLIERAAEYNPRLPRETPKNYEIRLSLAKLTNLLAGAVRASEGLLVAKPPTLLDGVSRELAAIWADIDGFGTGGVVWLREVLRRMETEGVVIAVAASPVRSDTRPTLADEAALGLRPYVALYRAKDVMSARFERVGGKRVLAQIVLREQPEVADGPFATKTVTQYRVFQRQESGQHTDTVYRENQDGQFVVDGTPGIIETEELPVVEFSADPAAGFVLAQPPMLDLADATLEHYLVKSDRRWAMRCTCFPWLVRIGYTDDGTPAAAGPSEAIDLPPGGDAKFIAPSAESMQPTRDELTDIERRAAALSLSFLAGEHPGEHQTATAADIDQEGQDAGLAAILVSVRDGLNKLFALFDELLGNTPRDEYFSLSTKLRGLRRDPAFIRLVLEAWKEGGLPIGAMLHALQHGELPDDFDTEQAALDALAEADAARELGAQRQRDQQPDQSGDGDADAGRVAA